MCILLCQEAFAHCLNLVKEAFEADSRLVSIEPMAFFESRMCLTTELPWAVVPRYARSFRQSGNPSIVTPYSAELALFKRSRLARPWLFW
jgi:hypothetical protein